jgi:glycosyltransferase involved in cell wall biosynthesis
VNSLRILQMIPDLRVGGAERVAVTLSNGLAEAGHEVLLVAIKAGGPQAQQVRTDLGVKLLVLGIQRASIRHPLRFWTDMRALRRQLDDILREFRPDVVQTHIPEDDLLASDCVRRTGIGVHLPLIHSLQFHLHRKKMDFRGRMRLKMFARMAANASAIWVVSAAVGLVVRQLTGLASERIKVLHNGLDLRPYEQLPGKVEARAQLGLPEAGPMIGAVGRLHPAKNFPLLVRASKDLLRNQPQAHFFLVGEGPERARIEAEISAQGVKSAWTLLGMRPDVPTCLAAADYFVQASDWEGFPVAVIEAMAANLPIVATEVAGISEVLEDQVNGLLIPVGGQAELALALDQLIRKPEIAQSLAAEAKNLAWSHYNLSAYISRTEALLQQALSKQNA